MLSLANDGAELVRGALSVDDLLALEAVFATWSEASAGLRIAVDDLETIVAMAKIGDLTAKHLGPKGRAVRAILFDKSEKFNWALGWHQDRTIAVKSRIEIEGFGPWTVKAGLPHVAPPIEVLEGMVTVRVHLDAVDEENAPLLISPRSHRRGLIAERDIDETVTECGRKSCLAEAGDVWLYSTLILHASARAVQPRRRRVLQIDYSANNLPGGLEWAADA